MIKDRLISFRLSAIEHNTLVAKAKEGDVSVASIIRRILKDHMEFTDLKSDVMFLLLLFNKNKAHLSIDELEMDRVRRILLKVKTR